MFGVKKKESVTYRMFLNWPHLMPLRQKIDGFAARSIPHTPLENHHPQARHASDVWSARGLSLLRMVAIFFCCRFWGANSSYETPLPRWVISVFISVQAVSPEETRENCWDVNLQNENRLCSKHKLIHAGNIRKHQTWWHEDCHTLAFQVGSMLFTLCCGRPPFGAGSIQVGWSVVTGKLGVRIC